VSGASPPIGIYRQCFECGPVLAVLRTPIFYTTTSHLALFSASHRARSPSSRLVRSCSRRPSSILRLCLSCQNITIVPSFFPRFMYDYYCNCFSDCHGHIHFQFAFSEIRWSCEDGLSIATEFLGGYSCVFVDEHVLSTCVCTKLLSSFFVSFFESLIHLGRLSAVCIGET